MAKNKVKFGLKNVHVWPITSASEEAVTFGDVIKMPGGVEITINPVGEDNKFYADDIVYWNEYSNNGYEGDITIAIIPEEYEIQVLGNVKDTNGAVIEVSNARPKNYAMAFEFNGDATQTRHILYNCSSSRPTTQSKTVEETKEPQTDQISFNAMPARDTQYVKAKLDKGQTGYDSWFTEPYVPVITPVP